VLPLCVLTAIQCSVEFASADHVGENVVLFSGVEKLRKAEYAAPTLAALSRVTSAFEEVGRLVGQAIASYGQSS
jgi:hypothetical protein